MTRYVAYSEVSMHHSLQLVVCMLIFRRDLIAKVIIILDSPIYLAIKLIPIIIKSRHFLDHP